MKKRKLLITLLIILGALIIILFEFWKPIYYSIFLPYHYEFKPERYNELFPDSARSKINKLSCGGDVGENDILYWYKIGQYKLIIWEFKNHEGIHPADIKLDTNSSFNYYSIADFAGHPDSYPRPFIKYRWGYHLSKDILLDFDSNCKIISVKDTLNYKSIFAKISYLSIKSNDEIQIVLDYKTTMINKIQHRSKLYQPSKDESVINCTSVPTYLLMFNKHKSFYIIIVNSEISFDESVIKLVKLN